MRVLSNRHSGKHHFCKAQAAVGAESRRSRRPDACAEGGNAPGPAQNNSKSCSEAAVKGIEPNQSRYHAVLSNRPQRNIRDVRGRSTGFEPVRSCEAPLGNAFQPQLVSRDTCIRNPLGNHTDVIR